jgi:hypothetical protein
MKMRFLLLPALLVTGLAALECAADPILPYQQPIEAQLTNDLAAGSPDARTLERALATYHRTSKSLRGDTTILRSLNSRLTTVAGYGVLLSNAAVAYKDDFLLRHEELEQQLVPAPISANKTAARTALTRVENSLSNALHATSDTARIRNLHTAAQRLAAASNSVQVALRTRPGLSVMVARVGSLSFNTERGRIAGSADFVSGTGGAVGEFSSSGVLSITAWQGGNVPRAIHLHLPSVTRDFPAVYPLGGENRAYYDATDLRRSTEFHFRAAPELTNSVVTNAFVAIDYIGTNSLTRVTLGTNSVRTTNVFYTTGYILGRFQFIGTNIYTFTGNTNTQVTISRGEFQLNFDIQSGTNGVPIGSE